MGVEEMVIRKACSHDKNLPSRVCLIVLMQNNDGIVLMPKSTDH